MSFLILDCRLTKIICFVGSEFYASGWSDLCGCTSNLSGCEKYYWLPFICV